VHTSEEVENLRRIRVTENEAAHTTEQYAIGLDGFKLAITLASKPIYYSCSPPLQVLLQSVKSLYEKEICTMHSDKKITRNKGDLISPLVTTVCTTLLLSTLAANASEPVKLSNAQLDTVSAGAVTVRIRTQATGNYGSVSSSKVFVSSNANTDGNYTLESAVAAGQSYVCCNGGKTSVKVDRTGAGTKTAGGTVTSTIRILNHGSYSFGLGVQVGLSRN